MTLTLSRREILSASTVAGAAIFCPQLAFAGTKDADWTLGVADVEADIAPAAMERIAGRAPAGLAGTLYRNGPAKFRRPGLNATHWFDGDGLMRRFAIGEGRATAQARFADTPKRRQEAAAAAMIVPGFGSAGRADAKIESNDDVNAANTSVMAAGDKVWALWEGGSPYAMDATTLASEGFVTLRADLRAMPFSAHPRYEPDGASGTSASIATRRSSGASAATARCKTPRWSRWAAPASSTTSPPQSDIWSSCCSRGCTRAPACR